MESHGHELLKPVVDVEHALVHAKPVAPAWVMQPLTDHDAKAKE